MNDQYTLDNLNINSYHANVYKLPYLNFKLKSIDTPSISLSPVEVPTPLQKMNVPGDHIEYGSLSMSFLIDENLFNYCGILNWMTGLGFPDSFEDFKNLLSSSSNNITIGVEQKRKSYTTRETSDIDIHLLTNHQNTNRILKLANAFPISLSGISLNNSNSDGDIIEASVDFAFTGMKFIL